MTSPAPARTPDAAYTLPHEHDEGAATCSTDNPASRVIREVLSRVGDKWSLLVIGVLHDGPRRFTEL
ncbi:MAG TPA: transcriptional regulator, partial [Microterricola sp.]